MVNTLTQSWGNFQAKQQAQQAQQGYQHRPGGGQSGGTGA